MTELEAAQKEIANLEAQRNICLAAAKNAQEEIETLKYRLQVVSDIGAEHHLLWCRAEAELSYARKVADAAVGWSIAHELKMRFIMAEAAGDPDADSAYRVMVGVVFEAEHALADALTAYRVRVEGVE